MPPKSGIHRQATAFSAKNTPVHWGGSHPIKQKCSFSRRKKARGIKNLFAAAIISLSVCQSVIPHLGALELQLQPVGDQGDELGVCGLSFGIGHRIAEEALQGVQVPSVPGDFNGMANGPLHSRRRGLEGLCHLGVEHLGNGVGVLSARLGSLLDGVCETSINNKFCGCIYCFISCPYHCWFVGLIPMITKSNF